MLRIKKGHDEIVRGGLGDGSFFQPLVIGIGGPVNTSLSSFFPRKTVTARMWRFSDQFNFSNGVLLLIQHLEIIMRRDDANFGSGIEFLLCMLLKEKELKEFTLWIENHEYLSERAARV